MEQLCVICTQTKNLKKCSRCQNTYYCSVEHQKQDWPKHKTICGKEQKKENKLIDQDNLKSNESVGTFRWNDSTKLLAIPKFKPEYLGLMKFLNKGWEYYLKVRFQETCNYETGEIVVQPHQVDGLSYPMTLVYILNKLQINLDKFYILIMGAAAKTEERIILNTNYFQEILNFYPQTSFKLIFIGPELSSTNHLKTIKKQDNLEVSFQRGTIQDFIVDQGKDITKIYPLEQTLLLGYNPGFGSGYDKLLESWILDLIPLLNLNYQIVFTQANDYSDLKGEIMVINQLFQENININLDPQENPFRAVTHYHEEGKKETSWSCSSTHFYGFKGWKDKNKIISSKEIRNYFKTNQYQILLQQLQYYSLYGGKNE